MHLWSWACFGNVDGLIRLSRARAFCIAWSFMLNQLLSNQKARACCNAVCGGPWRPAPQLPMQTSRQCRSLPVAGHGMRSRTAILPQGAPGTRRSKIKHKFVTPRACEARQRAAPTMCRLSMDARSGAVSETGLGHVFVSLFPGE